jgi:hypothetical protein
MSRNSARAYTTSDFSLHGTATFRFAAAATGVVVAASIRRLLAAAAVAGVACYVVSPKSKQADH